MFNNKLWGNHPSEFKRYVYMYSKVSTWIYIFPSPSSRGPHFPPPPHRLIKNVYAPPFFDSLVK